MSDKSKNNIFEIDIPENLPIDRNITRQIYVLLGYGPN